MKYYLNEYRAISYIAENKSYKINQELIEEKEKYDGYYALTTNLIGDILEIFKIVKGNGKLKNLLEL